MPVDFFPQNSGTVYTVLTHIGIRVVTATNIQEDNIFFFFFPPFYRCPMGYSGSRCEIVPTTPAPSTATIATEPPTEPVTISLEPTTEQQTTISSDGKFEMHI